jgi:hypothetical protein
MNTKRFLVIKNILLDTKFIKLTGILVVLSAFIPFWGGHIVFLFLGTTRYVITKYYTFS